RDVRDLMRKNAGELRLVPRRLDRTAVHPDGAARKRERIDLAVVGDRKRVRVALALRVRGQAPADPRDVSLHVLLVQLGSLAPDFGLRLLADRDFVGDRDQIERRYRRREQRDADYGPAKAGHYV